jgi:hypothetical protein
LIWGDEAPSIKELRWHYICTIRRDSENEFKKHAIHADTFDGTLLAFALTSNKIPTPVYPGAYFQSNAIDLFMNAAEGKLDNTCRPKSIRLAKDTQNGKLLTGVKRKPRDCSILILPAAVAHSVPSNVRLGMEESFDSNGEQFASKDDNRWFCRVSIEIIPGGSSHMNAHDGGAWQQWMRKWPTNENGKLRKLVCCLAAKHIWGDPDFARYAANHFNLKI